MDPNEEQATELYKTILQSIPDIIYKIDTDGNFVYLNNAVIQIGYDPEDLLGKHFSVILSDLDIRNIQSSFVLPDYAGVPSNEKSSPKLFDERRTGNRVTRNLRLKVKAAKGKKGFCGEIIATGMYDQVDGKSRYSGTLGIIRNINDIERSENALLLSERHHRMLTSNIIEIIMVIATDGTILYVTDSVLKNLGISSLDMIGENIYNFIHQEDAGQLSDRIWLMNTQNIEDARFTLRLMNASEEWRYFQTHAKKIIGHDKSIMCYLINAIDVTDQKQILKEIRTEIYFRKIAEQEKTLALQKAEMANRIKSDFLANISHEIRNPLNVILGYTDILINGRSDTEMKTDLYTIRDAGRILMETINKILDYAKLEAGKNGLDNVSFSTEELFIIIDEMFKHIAEKKDITFNIEKDHSVPDSLFGDQLKISQVLINLISNAIKFTNVGGVAVKASYDDENLTVKVSDTGIGIPQKYQEEIFLPFQQADASTTRQFGGTGLGLSIVKELVNLMNGKISLISEEGVGSTFIVTAPMPRSIKVKPRESVVSKYSFADDRLKEFIRNESESSFRILIAEDDSQNRKLIKRILKHPLIQVDSADNGSEAIKKINSEKYHLILLDMHMPVMDGFSVLKDLTERKKIIDLPVVVISGHVGEEFENECIRAGCRKVITKPIDINVLLTTLNEIINWWLKC